MPQPTPAPPDQPAAVLDTNVVLDWLVFDDPAGAAIGAAVAAGRLRWIACAAMRDEFAHVLPRVRPGSGAAPEAALAAWDRWALATAGPPPAHEPAHPRCTDPDDQVFIDLALHLRVPWLLTRDKALLALRRKAMAFGLAVVHPLDFARALPPRT